MLFEKYKKIINYGATSLLALVLLLSIFILIEKEGETGQPGEVTEMFEVRLPVEVMFADVFMDGRTKFVLVKDGKEDFFEFCLDGRREERGYFYINAIHPSDENAQKITYKGKGERELLKILNSWDSSDWEPRNEYDDTKEIAKGLIEKLEKRTRWWELF